MTPKHLQCIGEQYESLYLLVHSYLVPNLSRFDAVNRMPEPTGHRSGTEQAYSVDRQGGRGVGAARQRNIYNPSNPKEFYYKRAVL
jgi:hypothetical protein